MPKKSVTVVARIKAKPGMEETLQKELSALIAPTVQERGCINYNLHQSTEDRSVFMFYENWVSKKDLDDHLASPHLQAFLAKADELLAEPADISLWEPID